MTPERLEVPRTLVFLAVVTVSISGALALAAVVMRWA